MDKIRFTLSELEYKTVMGCLTCIVIEESTMAPSMQIMFKALFKQIFMRMALKQFSLKKKNILNMSIAEAMCFYLVMRNTVIKFDDWTKVIIQGMIDKIDKHIV